MNDKKERLRQIFIEEALEILDDLNSKIFQFEDNPNDKATINDIFRGIHTLKGSANSFGFVRLGEYVHHFEDLLDYYRAEDAQASADIVDLFLDALDVVKEMLQIEIEESDALPANYHETLQEIQKIIESERVEEHAIEEMADLAAEFGGESALENVQVEQELDDATPASDDTKKLYKIILSFEADAFKRGLDHANFLSLLSEEGVVSSCEWNFKEVPQLSELRVDECYISEVTIHYESELSVIELEEIFEFAEENEYKIIEMKEEAGVAQAAVEPTQQPEQTALQHPASSGSHTTAEVQKKEDIPQATVNAASDPKEEPKNEEKKEATKSEVRSFVKIDTEKLDELFDSVGELVIAQNFLMENSLIRSLENTELNRTMDTLNKTTRLIQNRVMALRMVPIRGVFDKMRRVARDVSKKLKKDVKLVLQGEDTEIDKTMVDKLSDPLIHIIRNAMDHGIESDVNDRKAVGKPEAGTVHLKAYHQGGNIIIEVKDDGRGINPETILSIALNKGLTTEADAQMLSKEQIFQFLLQPGFSTAKQVTDLSGRGVGMDVVNNFIEKMRGKIEISSELHKGSTFKILLPLTLAIIDGMLVRSSNEVYIIPTLSILESFRPKENSVHTANQKGEFVKLREELLPIVRLNHKLERSEDKPPVHESTLVCVESKNGRFTILVDELIGRQQVVIKTVGKALADIKEVSGGAVLGNGEIALILNVEELYER